MEDVLDVYNQPFTSGVHRLCFDERPCQLIKDVYAPLPAKPGCLAKYDEEYERKGTCCVLLAYDIDTGQRYLQVRKQRTKKDYAEFMDWLEKEQYADEAKIIVVQDNLNTHTYGSFYENLPVERAYQLKNKMEFHFTPKHGSWLNIAEIEFSALSKQCLDRKIGSMDVLEKEAIVWQRERNRVKVKVNWSFSIKQARTKLKRHYDKFKY